MANARTYSTSGHGQVLVHTPPAGNPPAAPQDKLIILRGGKLIVQEGGQLVGADEAQAAAIADLGAFTDPPSAAEMATLRTTVNSVLAVLRALGAIGS